MVQASARQLEQVLVLVQEWVRQLVLAVREREQEPVRVRVRRQTHRRPR
jgi:hypothetical protein